MNHPNYIEPASEPHIIPRENMYPATFAILIQICPMGLYWQDENDQHYDYSNCIECGACRIVADADSFRQWNFPDGGMGVDYTRNRQK